nr:MAG TPA: NinG recombination protein [Caudoviricetes sp.]
MNLIAKIGQQKFDLLKVKVASTSKMTDFEYEQLIKYYKALNKKLRKEKGL